MLTRTEATFTRPATATAPAISYTIASDASFFTVRSPATGRVLATLSRPRALAANPRWMLSDTDGCCILATYNRPTAAAVQAAISRSLAYRRTL